MNDTATLQTSTDQGNREVVEAAVAEALRVERERHDRELADLREANSAALYDVRAQVNNEWDSTVKAVTERLNEVRRDRDSNDAARVEAQRELEAFKVQVRERALQCKEDENWCDDGFNSAMRDLGLPELVRVWRGRVTIEVDVEVINTDNEDTARNWARGAMQQPGSNDGDVKVLSYDADDSGEYERYNSVEEARGTLRSCGVAGCTTCSY